MGDPRVGPAVELLKDELRRVTDELVERSDRINSILQAIRVLEGDE